MEDIEIYDLAQSVLFSIATDFNEGIYAKLGGKLKISFSEEKRASAWAISIENVDNPPQHEIVFCYELIRKIYRDCEDYYEFAIDAIQEEPFSIILQNFEPSPKIPDYIKKVNAIRNMYMGGLTWVFFHELGHLAQEHGYVRTKFGGFNNEIYIEDCESNSENVLHGRAAMISHVTELAADVEAIQWCTQELIRHFLPNAQDNKEHSLKEFKSNLQLFICGLSCTLYRFNGERHISPTEHPEGTHPTPIRRLDLCLANIYEKLDFNGNGSQLHNLNRKELVHICLGSAESVGLFWLWKYSEQSLIPDNFLAGQGISFDPYKKSYWSSIVQIWDELEPEVVKIRHFGNKMGILYFTDYVRSEVF